MSALAWVAIFAVALYAALPFIIRPKWKRLYNGRWGENGLTYIRTSPDAPKPLAIMAHEIAEWRYRYKRPWSWFGIGLRDSQLWGPAVETAAAVLMYTVREDVYIADRARTLFNDKRPYFKGWTRGRIELEIARRIPEAHKWVANNLTKIQKA